MGDLDAEPPRADGYVELVAVLVVSYGSASLVEQNLSRTVLPERSIVVVVDNFSDLDERQRVTAVCARNGWVLVAPGDNLGFGGGMNAAAEAALARGADVLLPLNPDAWIEGDGVAVLAEHARSEPAAQVSACVVRPDGAHFSSLMEVDLTRGRLRRVRDGERFENSELWVSGACFAMSAELWRRTGGFDDDYFLYWEDVDLSVKVAKSGGTVTVDERVTAIHDPGGTQEGDGDRKSPVYFYWNARNRLVFGAKHAAPGTLRRWVLDTGWATRNVLIRGGRRQLLRPRSSTIPVLRGTVAGLRFLARHRRRSAR